MFDILGVSVLVGLAGLFGWLAWRAWHARRRVLKWSGAVLSGLLSLVFAAALTVALVGYARLNRKYDNPVSDISVEMTPENIARGERFGNLCAGCHATDLALPMEGGYNFLVEGDAPPVGTPQLYQVDALTAAKLSPPATATGVRRCVVVPSPSCPLELSPQQ